MSALLCSAVCVCYYLKYLFSLLYLTNDVYICICMYYRCFLRVDDSIVQMKETRFFHVFNNSNQSESSDSRSVTIHMAVSWKELSLSTTATTGSSGSSIMQCSKSELRSPNELSEKLPVVNEKYQIPQYFTLQLAPTTC